VRRGTSQSWPKTSAMASRRADPGEGVHILRVDGCWLWLRREQVTQSVSRR
jgi:hypothetical protein